jgi:hypothetical protein
LELKLNLGGLKFRKVIKLKLSKIKIKNSGIKIKGGLKFGIIKIKIKRTLLS